MVFNQGFIKAKIEGKGIRVTDKADWLVLVQTSAVFLSLVNSVPYVILSGVFIAVVR